MTQIRVGIVGYGNLGRGVELSLAQNPDLSLVGVFTRRAPESLAIVSEGVRVYPFGALEKMVEEIDVLILCGGSANDLPEQTPMLAKWYNLVDSFDTHARIPEHFKAVDEAARAMGKVAVISAGWDPGLFSLNRLYGEAILPVGQDYTFWGKGVSQGHSDAIRRIPNVVDGKQYTIPSAEAMDRVRSGLNPELSTREKHTRECFVVAEEGADLAEIEKTIKTMPNYFADYDTKVHFVSGETLAKEHGGIPHGGFVIRSGKTGENEANTHLIEYGLKLDSNPEFTASVLVCYARAAYRLAQAKNYGAKTVFDIAPGYLSPHSGEELRSRLL